MMIITSRQAVPLKKSGSTRGTRPGGARGAGTGLIDDGVVLRLLQRYRLGKPIFIVFQVVPGRWQSTQTPEENRQGSGATLITSQFPVNAWHETIPDPSVADAILDRLIHNAPRIELKGESMRKRKS